ncbi:double-strand break repair protein MRE11 [Aeropyrum pernix K1]|uniref:DNA double-strand break repair protein Mre11 n=1 Tax=Aeropyrum pernix (strain ATCC 700893 / DSM 11879 / JCM 9820 / NBRC 100138 / K1) TaxID=272557 RepID=MRE11_AERPE|nr:exonuclease SbcCD subunit D [Aeropyrum pernix]Q9YFY8.1 RecName: Full=DNA double-strand break repair protein Mre11 [Aeropyrum pernix K1]BAA79023.1 double-strand break repair protein MRE11 [Aeropyrum pernix K1]
MPKVLHVADVHLGARPYGLEERRDDIFRSFEFVVETALKDRPDAVLIAGDLFDKPKLPLRDVKQAVELVRALTDAGIPVLAAHGEHDTPSVRDETLLSLMEASLDGFKAPLYRSGMRPGDFVVDLGSLKVAVVPFFKVPLEERRRLTLRFLREFDQISRTSSGTLVLLAHMSLDAEMQFDAVASPSDLPSGAKYAALGHLHAPRIRLDAPTPYAYPGVLDPLKVEEINTPGSPLYVDLSGDAPIIEKVKVPRRPQYRIEVDIGDGGSIYNAVNRGLRRVLANVRASREDWLKPLIHVIIKSDKPISKARVIAEARKAAGGADVLLKIHWKIVAGGEHAGTSPGLQGEGPLDLAKIAAEYYKIPLNAASTILHDLAEAAAEKDELRVREILETLATTVSQDTWKRILYMR